MKARTVYALALLFEIIWLCGILAAPYMESIGLEGVSTGVYKSYASVCHQRAERSFFIFGEKMAVCARCFGIYAGFLVGTVAYALYRKLENKKMPDYKVVLLALLPLAIDGITQLLGFRESTNMLRLVTGMLFGIIFMQYFMPLAVVRLGERP